MRTIQRTTDAATAMNTSD